MQPRTVSLSRISFSLSTPSVNSKYTDNSLKHKLFPAKMASSSHQDFKVSTLRQYCISPPTLLLVNHEPRTSSPHHILFLQIILGSSSVARKQILADMGFEFTTMVSSIYEVGILCFAVLFVNLPFFLCIVCRYR